MRPLPPLQFRYEGEGTFQTLPRHRARCDEYYVIGAYYPLALWEDRSLASHNHQFAWLAEAWANLPENLKDLYPSPEHFRKRLLVEAGYYTEEVIDAGTKAAAERVAAYARRHNEFAVVIVRGTIVLVRTPESQKRRAMGKERFQDSKTKIMEIAAEMIGVTPEALSEAGRAAA